MGFAISLLVICMLIGNAYDLKALGHRTNGGSAPRILPISFQSDAFDDEGQRCRRLADRWYAISSLLVMTFFVYLWITE